MTETEVRHFLVVYDIEAGHADVRDYGPDYDRAISDYEKLEDRYRARGGFDIVLLGADSIETVRRTHSSYFETAETGFDRHLPHEFLVPAG